jgi:hypothetical protein
MANGWADFGAALGGDSELEYEQGRALGAKTEQALAAARESVNKNAARQQSQQTFEAAGVPPEKAKLLANSVLGEYDLGQQFGGLLKQQEYDLRATAGDPTKSFSERNIALQGVAPGPVDRFQKIGRGVDDRFDEAGVTDLGSAFGDSGSNSAQMQLLDRFGFPSVLADDAQKDLALSTLRDTFGTGVAGEVPFSYSKSPYAHGGPQPLNPAAAPGGAAPPPAPAAAAPRVTPLVPVSDVAANTAAVAAAKAKGTATGGNAASLPTAINTIDTFSKDVDKLVNSKGFDSIYGARAGTAAGQAAMTFIDQDAADAAALRKKINAESFRASISSMRGLGQLSNAEGEKVQAALTTLADPHISPAAARQAAIDLKTRLEELKRVAQIEASMAPAAQAPGGPISLDEYLRSKGH